MLDLKTEHFLNYHGYRYEYQVVPISQIDYRASAENPARLRKALDDARVQRYAELMGDGVKFPAIVLLVSVAGDAGGFIVATGMHRLAAFRLANIQTVDAYVVREADEIQAEVLVRSLNGIEGEGDDTRTIIRHALELHRKYGISYVDLAKRFHINERTLGGYGREEKSHERGLQLGIDLSSLAQVVAIELNRIPNDTVFATACNFAICHRPTGAACDLLVDEIATAGRSGGTSAELAVVEKWHRNVRRDDRADKMGRTGPTIAGSFMSRCRSLVRVGERGMQNLYLSALNARDKSEAPRILADIRTIVAEAEAEFRRIRIVEGTETEEEAAE